MIISKWSAWTVDANGETEPSFECRVRVLVAPLVAERRQRPAEQVVERRIGELGLLEAQHVGLLHREPGQQALEPSGPAEGAEPLTRSHSGALCRDGRAARHEEAPSVEAPEAQVKQINQPQATAPRSRRARAEKETR